VDMTLQRLGRLGLSAYESKALLALLKAHPLNGYRVGKAAGVPTSKVYETLGRLRDRGLLTVDESVTPSRYYPVPVKALVGRIRSQYDAAILELENDLALVTMVPALDPSWNLRGYEAVLVRAAAVIKAASRALMLSLWAPEHERLRPEIRRAEARGVKVILALFGGKAPRGPWAVSMTPCGPSSRKRLGARLMVAARDSTEVLVASVSDRGDSAGIVTDTPQVVLVAKEYVRHDVWGRLLIQELGEDRFRALCRREPILSHLIKER
jgi:HTH-type transcriptional regulator, sugar sensing transcriptional regulator